MNRVLATNLNHETKQGIVRFKEQVKEEYYKCTCIRKNLIKTAYHLPSDWLIAMTDEEIEQIARQFFDDWEFQAMLINDEKLREQR